MADYIEREAAIEAMKQLEAEDIEAYGVFIPEGFHADPAIERIESIPPADVRAVVLCKNCMCYDSRNFLCEHFNAEMGREDYCSYGY